MLSRKEKIIYRNGLALYLFSHLGLLVLLALCYLVAKALSVKFIILSIHPFFLLVGFLVFSLLMAVAVIGDCKSQIMFLRKC